MLPKALSRFRVSEVHLCLPFVQITVERMEEEKVAEEKTAEESAIEETPQRSTTALQRPLPRVAPNVPLLPARAIAPSTQAVALAVQPRDPAHGVEIAPHPNELTIQLMYRIATEVDAFGPVFRMDWQPIASGLDVYPGDYLWLRLSCENRTDRVFHHVRMAMEGIDVALRQCGILIHGTNGWPRTPVRDVTAGQELSHINPGDSYSLHCVLRVPPDILQNKRARFVGIRPEFNILKQLS